MLTREGGLWECIDTDISYLFMMNIHVINENIYISPDALQDEGWRQVLRRDKDPVYKEIFQNEDKDLYVNGFVFIHVYFYRVVICIHVYIM